MMRAVTVLLVLALAGCTSNAPSAGPPPEPEPRSARASVRWDPRDVDDLPAAGRRVAPGLPARVTPPDHATLLADASLEAAVLTLDRRRRGLLLLGTDGSWREVHPAERYGQPSLSPDGTRLAILLDDQIELWHLPTGDRTELALPDRFRPWDFERVGWLDSSMLLLDDLGGGWRIELGSGTVERTPYPRRFYWTVDPGGTVLEMDDTASPPVLYDWADGSPRRIDLAGLGTTLEVDANTERVAGTAYDERGFEAFALDRSAPEDVITLPMRDFEGNYSNWALRSVHVLDDGSVLLWVAVVGRRDVDGWRLVRWDPDSERLAIVTTSPANPTWWVRFAGDLLE